MPSIPFGWVDVRIELVGGAEILPWSLSAQPDAPKIRREGKNRAALLGMTEGGPCGPMERRAFAFSVIPSGRADFLWRSRCANVGPAERDRGNQPCPTQTSGTPTAVN